MNSLCVLIVDDDPNTVRMIEDAVPWEDYGISEVHTAFQGIQALQIVENIGPDIVISDIEMPQMDGIQLVEAISKRTGIKPEIIFLTAHADFSYAQQAIYYGVSAYLVKPFQLEELSASLTRAVLKCHDQRRSSEDREFSEENRGRVTDEFYRDLLWGQLKGNDQEIGTEAARRKVNLETTSAFQILSVIISTNAAKQEGLERADLYFAFRNLCSELLFGNEKELVILGNDVRPYTVFLIPVCQIYMDSHVLEEKSRKLIELAKTYLHIEISCLLSPAVYVSELSGTREKIEDYVLQNRSEGTVLHLNETMEGEDTGISQEELGRLLFERNKAGIQNLVKDHLMLLERQKIKDAAHMKTLHHDVMQVFYSFIYENHIKVNKLFQDRTFQTLNEEAEYSSKNMIKYVGYLYDRSFEMISVLQQSGTLIERIKEYIRNHMSENIKREEIAEAVYISPNYLSSIFRKESGVSLREFINMVRVEEAKKLLVSTDKSVTEIAMEVGFDTIPYFSTIFGKICGTTPGVFRSRFRKGEEN